MIVRFRRVHHHHAALRRRRDVHVVEPDAGTTDDDEVTARRKHRVVDFCRRSDDESLGAGDRLDQLVWRETEAHVDLMAGGRHHFDAPGAQLLGDENPRHLASFLSWQKSARDSSA